MCHDKFEMILTAFEANDYFKGCLNHFKFIAFFSFKLGSNWLNRKNWKSWYKTICYSQKLNLAWYYSSEWCSQLLPSLPSFLPPPSSSVSLERLLNSTNRFLVPFFEISILGLSFGQFQPNTLNLLFYVHFASIPSSVLILC